MKKPVYLDYAAATPVDPRVMTAMAPYYQTVFYNPSAIYAGAREAKAALVAARVQTAKVLGVRPSEIIFTAGGSESANLAIKGIMERYPDATIVHSAVEHDAVLQPAQLYNAVSCPVNPDGRIDPAVLKKLLTDTVVLVSVMYLNNEIGSLQPISELAELIKTVRRDRQERGIELPLYFHCDAAQAGNCYDLQISRLGVDLMTINGGKLYGPKQSGILYVRAGIELQPQILGGGQEFGLRSGTENVAQAIGFALALEIAQSARRKTYEQLDELSGYFKTQLETVLGARINGSKKHSSPHIVHATFFGCDNERMLYKLDDLDIWAAAGSACSAKSGSASHVLEAIGIPELEARASLRFSLGRATTKAEIDRTIATLQIAVSA